MKHFRLSMFKRQRIDDFNAFSWKVTFGSLYNKDRTGLAVSRNVLPLLFNYDNVLYFIPPDADQGSLSQHSCQGSRVWGLRRSIGTAAGKSVNIAWNHKGVTDADYSAWHRFSYQ